jgi:hypothetical protein
MTNEPVYVFIVSWERPIYLWLCLDSLYRHTQHPRRFVLVDNASTDPLVHQVIESFERRELFHAVHRMSTNSPANMNSVLRRYLPDLGRYVGYVESDTVVLPTPSGCWLRELLTLCEANPDLAMLGSYCDVDDFVAVDVARRLHPELSERELIGLVHGNSPERTLSAEPPAEQIVSPFNPPGRLVLFRAAAIAKNGFQTDYAKHCDLVASGWQTGISTAVRHRHLSLLHVFDEPSYDTTARAEWFTEMRRTAGRLSLVRLKASAPGRLAALLGWRARRVISSVTRSGR